MKAELSKMDIGFDDVQKQTPALEDFLVEIAREAGATEAVLFDGTVINLVNSKDPTNA
jgi:hypothetical protein